jgi:hypothetical protein
LEDLATGIGVNLNTLTTSDKTISATADVVKKSEKEIISEIEFLMSLLIFALAWAMLIISGHIIAKIPEARLQRLVSYHGQVYCVTGKVQKVYFKAILFGGKQEILIPIKGIHRVADIDNNDC